MKILIGNNTLSWIGGTETATYALATEMKKQNDDVTAFSDSLGLISDKLEAKGIKCRDNLKEDKFDIVLKPKNDLNFDIIHAHHYHTTEMMAKNGAPMVFTSHGLLWERDGRICPEHPPFHLTNVKKWVAVSEEVQARYAQEGVEAIVIRNGIDLERFKPVKPLNKELKKVLIITNWWGSESECSLVLGDVVGELQLEVFALGANWAQEWDVEKVMNDVDLVIAYGRGALEAMSCGRPVLVYGHNGADGLVTPENYDEIKKCNFSGRRFAEQWDAKRLKEELLKWNPKLGKDVRKLMEKNHNIKDIVNQYKEVYKEVICQNQ